MNKYRKEYRDILDLTENRVIGFDAVIIVRILSEDLKLAKKIVRTDKVTYNKKLANYIRSAIRRLNMKEKERLKL